MDNTVGSNQENKTRKAMWKNLDELYENRLKRNVDEEIWRLREEFDVKINFLVDEIDKLKESVYNSKPCKAQIDDWQK